MKDDRIYLEHILEAMRRIETYTVRGKQDFMLDSLVQDGVLRNLQTLAESSSRLSNEVKRENPRIDWRAIAGFRNILVHDYLKIDLDRVWGVVQNRLPPLKSEIEKMIREFDRE